MAPLLEQAYESFGEEARRRGIEYRVDVDGAAGDRHRRRPRAADHLEPALRTPSPGRPTADAIELELAQIERRRSPVAVADTGPGHRRRRSESGSSGRSGPRGGGGTGSRPARSRASSRIALGGRDRRSRVAARARAPASSCVLPAA